MEVPSITLTIKEPTIDVYVKLVSPLYNLTTAEIDVVSEFILLQLNYPNKNVFSTKFRKMVAKQLGKSNLYVNNYVSALKKKGVLSKEDDKLILAKVFNLSILPESIMFKLNWKHAKQ